MKINNFITKILKIAGFGERRCINCLAPFEYSETQIYLCADCEKKLKSYRGAACPVCGEPFMQEICLPCLKGRPWDHLAFYGLYAGELRDLIRRLKYDGELIISVFLASLLFETSSCLPRPDVIIPLPQYPPNLRKRGFNQTHEIARFLAKFTGFPLGMDYLFRIRHKNSQASLKREARKLNVKNDFISSSQVDGKEIWLVDDVMTTGSTLEAAANSLKMAGCGKISLLIVARTPYYG